jgi:hypothetical protein
MPGIYLYPKLFIEQIARKVVSRVITDGIALDEAIKEAIKFADLDKQQIIHLCSTLQDYNMPYSGDGRSYFHTNKELGDAVPVSRDGFNTYASLNNVKQIFAEIQQLKDQGMSNEQILDINPELEELIDALDNVEGKFGNILRDVNNMEDVNNTEEMQIAARSTKNIKTAQEAEVKEANPENLNEITNEEPKEELSVDNEKLPENNEELPEEDLSVAGEVSAKITPGPEELMSEIQKAPKWDVNNMLSVSKAESYFKKLKEELETVVYNENISIDMDGLNQYDKVREAIDKELNKIEEAQKAKEKLEKKEIDMQEKFQEDKPTEELIEEPQEELSVENEPKTEEVNVQ